VELFIPRVVSIEKELPLHLLKRDMDQLLKALEVVHLTNLQN
jgi:hypothetical protein